MQEGHKFWREFFIQLEIWIQEFEVVSWICTQLGGFRKRGLANQSIHSDKVRIFNASQRATL